MTDPTTDRPLVTFALFAYNQEQYIREAVEGAFSQTYEPLEIILSDDCSSDRTFEIMQEMAAAYEGLHKIIYLKSKDNLGLSLHINRVAEVANGEIIVMAAGDDRSHCKRTAEHVNVYRQRADATAVYSAARRPFDVCKPALDKSPKFSKINTLRTLISGGGLGKGATYSYRKACYFWPSQLPGNLKSEDRVLPLRASLLGAVYRIDAKLITYGLDLIGNERVSKRHALSIFDKRYWAHHRFCINAAVEQNQIKYIYGIFLFLISYYVETVARCTDKVGIRFPTLSKAFWIVLSGPLRFFARLY